MKTPYIFAAMFLITCFTSGCAPTEEDFNSTSTATTENEANQFLTVQNTSDLVANQDFDFRSDREISIRFPELPSDIGKLVLYHTYEYYDSTNKKYYPDHTSRIASYVADTNLTYTVQALTEWTYLIIEWLPMDGKSNEDYLLLALSDSDVYELRF